MADLAPWYGYAIPTSRRSKELALQVNFVQLCTCTHAVLCWQISFSDMMVPDLMSVLEPAKKESVLKEQWHQLLRAKGDMLNIDVNVNGTADLHWCVSES